MSSTSSDKIIRLKHTAEMVRHSAQDYLYRLGFLKCSIAFWTDSGYVIYHLEPDEARKLFQVVRGTIQLDKAA